MMLLLVQKNIKDHLNMRIMTILILHQNIQYLIMTTCILLSLLGGEDKEKKRQEQ